ncbi:hypothetical protein MMC13_003203 [Lambiella insularis]|nr:hypothetical protein [Lambiella insularis]
MTAVASPPSLQSLPRLGWNSGNSAQGLNSMSADDVSRMFMPRKDPEKKNSSSSLSSTLSTSSSASDSTISLKTSEGNLVSQSPEVKAQAEREGWIQRKKPARGLWPSSKAEAVSGISNARPQSLSTPLISPSAASTMSAVHQPSPVIPSQNMPQTTQQVNGNRPINGQGGSESSAVLVLLPMNGTFERKQIAVPLFPEILRIGRQTNAKTVPTPLNGYFDSKVLSRSHAEIWADRNSKIWIRDVKSSNGTFVNGVRLSPENRDSEPHELREHDMLELGIDIVSEDQKSIVHHKVSAKVEHAGIPNSTSGMLDLNFGDIDPGSNGGLMGPTFPQHMTQMRGRNGSQGSINSNGRLTGPPSMAGSNINGIVAPRQMSSWLSPITIEQVVKKLTTELKQAKFQSQDLNRTGDFFHALLAHEPGQELPKSPIDVFAADPQINGVALPAKSDPMSPFSQPPAPPPQQPLPEKPDVARSVLGDTNGQPLFKRNEADIVRNSVATSPMRSEASSSQILSLVEALTSAKRQIDSQGDRVKQLEDLLRQERKARESAEERARRLLHRTRGFGGRDESDAEDIVGESSESMSSVTKKQRNGSDVDDKGRRSDKRSPKPESSPESPTHETFEDLQCDSQELDASTSVLQNRLDLLMKEMDEMRQHMETYKRRAEGAEEERNGLADMVEKIRKGDINAEAGEATSWRRKGSETSTQTDANSQRNGYIEPSDGQSGALVSTILANMNGKSVSSMNDVQEIHEVVKSVLEPSNHRNDRLMQSAPYASMLGVVLIGVGIMTYLNGWQKVDR